MSLSISGISGGEKLQQHLEKMVGNNVRVRVGILEGAVYPNGTNTALVGFVQEFGNKNIPPRSFMRSTIVARIKAWRAGLTKEIRVTGYSYPQALGRLGTVMRDDFKKQIAAITSPPLKPETVRRKESDKPLIHTGQLENSIQYEVVSGESE